MICFPQSLYNAIALAVPIAILLANAQTERSMVAGRPPSRLLSWRFMLSLAGLCFLTVAVILATYLHLVTRPWYVETTFPPSQLEWSDPRGVENTVLFLIATLTLLTNTILVHGGAPFRHRFYTNIPLLLVTVAGVVFTVVLVFSGPTSALGETFGLMELPTEFRLVTLGYGVTHCALSALYDSLLVPLAASQFTSTTHYLTSVVA